jgi:DNA replication initiation complex subunit (GINS family)
MENYLNIRFLADEDPIMGVDLREYGPFKTGDVVYLPAVHARIFITNGKAQQIMPSE